MFDNYNRNDFEKYFNFADIDKFTIDLSNYNLIQVISKMISIKSKMSPNYGKKFSCLLHNLILIQKDFDCKLMPWHITDIFWNNFRELYALVPNKTLAGKLP